MKKLTFLIALMVPFFVFAQTQVTLTNGQKFDCEIVGIWGSNLAFKKVVPLLENDKVNVRYIAVIAGKIPESTKKSISRKNKAIVFVAEINEAPAVAVIPPTTAIVTEAATPKYAPPLNSLPSPIEFSAGDYLQKAGNRYFAGISVGTVGAGIFVIGSTKDQKELSIVGGITMLTGAIISLTGHSMLIKAGKKLNNHAITITPATQGIGVAFNF